MATKFHTITCSIYIWMEYIYIYIYLSDYNELTIYCQASDTIKVEIYGEFLMSRFSLSKYM